MKKKIKTLLALTLALCLTATTAVPALALSGRDAYYLAMLRPRLPKTSESYPARLRVDIPGRPPTSFSLAGKIGMDATISDEEMLAILKKGLPGEKSYKELQNPVDDKVLVQELTEKLKFSEADIQNMLDNWKKLLGVDTIADLLSGNLPEIGASDVVNSILDGATGDIPMMPGPPGAGTVVDGLFISWEEYQKDQQKYRDIIALSQAKQRLRVYYAVVDQLVRDFISEHGGWTLRIDGKDTQTITYEGVEGNTQTMTADIKLTKDDGSAGNIGGTYNGHFKLRWDTDLRAFDAGYGAHCVDIANAEADIPGLPKPPVPTNRRYVLATDEGPPSEYYVVMEAEDYQLKLSLPYGANRAFIEMPLSADPLFLTDYTQQVQRTVIIEYRDRVTFIWKDRSLNIDDDHITDFDIGEEYSGGEVHSWDHSLSEDMPIHDYTSIIRMTLVVDMLD